MCAVEWKKLGDVVTIQRGDRVTKKDLLPCGEYPVISGGIQPLGYIDKFNRPKNTITIAQYGTAGYVNWQNVDFWANDVCYSIFPKEVEKRYLYYTLQNMQDYIYSLRIDAIPAHLPLDRLKNIIIPIPSLAKQQEIVSHLDTFTTLISNLESELDMRRKQYEHYRNQLLDFEGVEIKLLKELATVKRGVRVVKTDLEEFGEIPVYQNSLTPLGYKENNNRNKNTTFVISAGAAGEIGFSDIDFWAADDCSTINCGERLIDKYIYHFLITKQSFLKSRVRKASIPRLASSFIENLEVPVPSLAKQQEIVEKLDAFENLIQSLEQEIKLRKQQYEYYREKLLTFEYHG